MRRVETSVLVVGAGPVGLAASLLLARQGMAHLVVDRRPGPHRAPQAHVVNPRTLEIFRQLDLDTTRLRRLATPREDGGWVSWVTCLTGPELGRLPYERQGDDVLALTPEPILNLPQHVLEPVLVEDVARVAGPVVRWRHEWHTLSEDADGVTSRIHDLDGGEDYEVRSRWVLAADGAGSPVRKAVGIPMVGPDRLQSFVMIHFEANLRDLVRARPAIIYWVMDPDRMGTFIAHDLDRTWVFMHPFDSDQDPVASYDAVRCAAIVRRAIGREDVALTVRDVSPWHMTSQVAASYRAGRVFLVGDSAHRFPPAGGMGMNTGIQDAHGLVWKLALVDAGVAGEGLLDTYERERRPVAQRNADQSLVNAMRMLQSIGELGLGEGGSAAQARLAALVGSAEGRARAEGVIEAQREHFDMLGLQLGFGYEEGALVSDGTPPEAEQGAGDFVPSARPGRRLPHVWIVRGGHRCSSLDLIDPGAFTILAGAETAAGLESLASAAPLRVQVLRAGRDFDDPDDGWWQACGVERDGVVLVRPDQHVAWRAARAGADTVPTLAAALAAVVGARAQRVEQGGSPPPSASDR